MTRVVRARNRPRRHPLIHMYYRLRTRRDTPRQNALAVWLGVAVGCTPLFGLHLPLCFVLARMIRVSGVTTYLASYVNNPFATPLVLYLSAGVGQWLFTGQWLTLDFYYPSATDVWHLGRDILVGGLVLGLSLGGLLAALVYWFSTRRHGRHALERRLRDATARRYLPAGVFHWEFVRGKLTYDPLYFGLLKADLLPRAGRLLDLGCGRGIWLALLVKAARLYASGHWRADWPPPPSGLTLSGVDASPANIAIAQGALGARAELRVADLRDYQPPTSNVVLLLDVLHYLPAHCQQDLLGRVHAVLEAGGLLLIRDADADAGIRFALTWSAERLAAWCRGHWRQHFHYRGMREWTTLLEGLGFTVATRNMSARTPFANALIEARKKRSA